MAMSFEETAFRSKELFSSSRPGVADGADRRCDELDSREVLRERDNGGDSGPAFVSGKSAESRIIKYVAGVDPDVLMPPEGDKLTDEQIGLLRGWIDQGADWPANAPDKRFSNPELSNNVSSPN